MKGEGHFSNLVRG